MWRLGVLCFGLVCSSSAQQVAITSTNSMGVVINVASGQNVSMNTYNSAGQLGQPDNLVASQYLETRLGLALDSASEDTSQQIVNALAQVRINLTTIENAVSSNAAALISAESSLRTEFRAETSDLRASISSLTQATQALAAAIPTNRSCQPRNTLAPLGTETGHGLHPGAIRILACTQGGALVGVPNGETIVVCNANGNWSDGNAARCSQPTTTASPTSAPSPAQRPEIVTCCAGADNEVIAAFADGVRLSMTQVSRSPLRTIRFMSTATSFVLHAKDNECGCLCGNLYFQCSTASGNTRWDTVMTPNPGYVASTAALNASFHRQWSIKQIAQFYPTFDPSLLVLPPSVLIAGGVANGFLTPQLQSSIGPFRSLNTTNARAAGCPATQAGSLVHFENTANRVGIMCGRPNIPRPTSSATRQRVDWWARVEP
eukprot:m.25675 g.25675  ORF g.25675 m.25675 type:complete len:432 (+) comp6225_c0_seq1:9-1304(+)